MSLGLIRFAVIMLAALSLSFGLGHLMELPARMAWDQYLWVGATVQGGLYALSGPLGVLVQVTTIIALIVLAVLLRRHGAGGLAFTIAAAVLFAIGLLVWWVFVYPVNVELTKWVNGPVPNNWADWRALGVGAGGQWARPARGLCRARGPGAGGEGQAAALRPSARGRHPAVMDL
jgi:hypothetical protein